MVGEVGNKVLDFLKSKYFLYGLATVIVIFIIWKYNARIKQFFSRDNGDYSKGIGDTETTKATQEEVAARKKYIENLAMSINAAINGLSINIYGWEITDRIELFKLALALNDSELKYLANYYSIISKDETLYQAIDGEWLFLYNEDDKLLARLSKLNEA